MAAGKSEVGIDMKKRLVIVLGAVAVVAVLYCAFWLLNFRAMSSDTAYDATVASSNPAAESGQAVIANTPTNLYVEGDSELAAALRARLANNLGGVPGLAPINLVSEPTEQRGTALVYVTLKEQRVRWTPFYARTELVVQVAYSSNGDVAFRQQDPPHFQQTPGNVALQVLGTYAMADVSKGAMSRPGYQGYLAAQMADYVRSSLGNQIVK
jgi:hypothetical protein